MKTTLILCALAAIAASIFAQGPLTPPPGTPVPGMKTLEQIEPRTPLNVASGDPNYHSVINAPGSYYLTGNLDVTRPNGVRIQSDGVTLDLNGFTIRRTGGPNGGDAITLTNDANRCTVRNGTIGSDILGTFGYGLNCTGTPPARGGAFRGIAVTRCIVRGLSTGEGWTLEKCAAHDNTGDGIWIGKDGFVTGSSSTSNNGYGFFARGGTRLTTCTASENAMGIVLTETGCAVHDCTIVANTEAGIFLDHANDGSPLARHALTNCVVSFNGGDGVGAFDPSGGASCSVSNVSVFNNGGAGIAVSSGTVTDCVSAGNGDSGIGGGSGFGLSGVISRCFSYNNAGVGIEGSGVISECSADSNSMSGIRGSGLITNCKANNNTEDGIEVSSKTRVIGNLCRSNDRYGIGLTDSFADGVVIDGNFLSNNNTGIRVGTAGNFMFRNVVSESSTVNYSIVAGNRYGPIVNLTAGGAAAASGNSAAGTLTTADPWANVAQ